MGLIQSICLLLRAFLKPRLSLAAENLALRQQLATYHHSRPKPKLRKCDWLFGVVLSRLWPGCPMKTKKKRSQAEVVLVKLADPQNGKPGLPIAVAVVVTNLMGWSRKRQLRTFAYSRRLKFRT